VRKLAGTCHLLARWYAEPISSTLKMEAICSSETSIETQRTTRRHIPKDETLQNHRCGNLKSYKYFCILQKLLMYPEYPRMVRKTPFYTYKPNFVSIFLWFPLSLSLFFGKTNHGDTHAQVTNLSHFILVYTITAYLPMINFSVEVYCLLGYNAV
jgi:hypothetical protein